MFRTALSETRKRQHMCSSMLDTYHKINEVHRMLKVEYIMSS